MDEKDIISIAKEQEKILRFKYVDLEMLKRISLNISKSIEERKATGYVQTIVNGTLVFSLCLPGATQNNEDWTRRKANLTARYWMSSLHATLNMKRNGKTLDICGMDSKDYGLSGGSFPILLESGICIGSITVSGMTEWEDHQVVADAIASELGVTIPSVL